MHHVFHTMGIPVHVTTFGHDAQITEALAACERVFRSWDEEFSRFKANSALVKLNASAGSWQNVSPRMFAVLESCIALAQETHGAFDPSVGGQLAAYGYGLPENYTPPDLLPTYRDIQLDKSTGRIKTALKQVLEPAALVKGMAIDEAGATLKELPAWMINAGGDILTHGDFPEQGPWRVAIQHPRNTEAVAAAVHIHNEALATSGTYEVRGETADGMWHHEINMNTRQPVRGIASLSVIAPTALEADTLTSVGFLYGLERGIQYLEKRNVPYLFIDARDRMYKNSLFAEREIDLDVLFGDLSAQL